jgi:hypothetical protein
LPAKLSVGRWFRPNVLQIPDGEFDLGVAAVEPVEVDRVTGLVGDERVVLEGSIAKGWIGRPSPPTQRPGPGGAAHPRITAWCASGREVPDGDRFGAGRWGGQIVVDLDATLVETYEWAERGAEQGVRTGRAALTRSCRARRHRVCLHARWRRGRSNDASGAPAFDAETLSRIRAAWIAGPVVLRADSGFYLGEALAACRKANAGFLIGARMLGRMRAVIARLDESA